MKTKIVKKIPGKLFMALDGGGYYRLFFQPKKGDLLVMESWNGGGYYEDVFFKRVEKESTL